MYLCKCGQNPSNFSEDNAQKRCYADADADDDAERIRTKNNMSPHPSGLGDINTRHHFENNLGPQNLLVYDCGISWSYPRSASPQEFSKCHFFILQNTVNLCILNVSSARRIRFVRLNYEALYEVKVVGQTLLGPPPYA